MDGHEVPEASAVGQAGDGYERAKATLHEMVRDRHPPLDLLLSAFSDVLVDDMQRLSRMSETYQFNNDLPGWSDKEEMRKFMQNGMQSKFSEMIRFRRAIV